MKIVAHVVLDFETASRVDLLAAGADRYAEDPTTEVICASLGIFLAHDPSHIRRRRWSPEEQTRELRSLAEDPDTVFIAHGAGFEQAIWREIMVRLYGFPPLPPERWHCTMAVCAMKALPLGLDAAAGVLKLTHQKDMAGSRLTRSLSRPHKKTGVLDRSPEKLEIVYAYCDQDVLAEHELLDRVGHLPAGERAVWLLDQAINQRGVHLDLAYVRRAMGIVDQARRPMAQEFERITGLAFGQTAAVRAWCAAAGLDLPDLRKDTLVRVLGAGVDDDLEEIEDDTLEASRYYAETLSRMPHVRRALDLRRLANSASVKKLDRMLKVVCADGRARGLLQYHGAQPGRWAGRLLQPQNFPRPTIEWDRSPVPMATVIEAIQTGDAEMVRAMVGEPTETVISGLRYAIDAAPGRHLVAGDYAGIQARTVLALAGQHDKTALMASGADVYCDMAASIYGHPITKKEHPEKRQVGKNTVLGCVFQMGAKKFWLRYCPHKTLEFAEQVIHAYRKQWAPLVPKLWYGLEGAAVECVWTRRPTAFRGIEFRLDDAWLTVRLPSGRRLWYYGPEQTTKPVPWDPDDWRKAVDYWGWKLGQWKHISMFGGQLTENIVCGIEADLLRHAIGLCEANEMPVVMLTHDELVCEPDANKSDAETVLTQIMLDVEPWARDLQIPIAIESWQGARYRK